jgi:diguanylate cyclase (GGDEF)-like protein
VATLYWRGAADVLAAGRLLAASDTARDGAVVLLDVDGMGTVNRRFGADVGDRLLADIHAALRKAIAGRGGVTGYGGDQFLAVLTGRRRWGAVVRALARTVRRVRVGETSVTVSTGLCSWAGDRPPSAALLTEAAMRLERAKRRRRRH